MLNNTSDKITTVCITGSFSVLEGLRLPGRKKGDGCGVSPLPEKKLKILKFATAVAEFGIDTFGNNHV